MNQEKIGKFISEMSKSRKMTQQELADKLNVTDRAVGNWENGRRLPDYSIIEKLCSELGININELFAGKKITDKEYKDISNDNLTKMVNKLNQENKIFEKKMTLLLIATTLLTMILIILLPLNSFKDVCIFILVILLAVISNTINIIAMALKNK